MNRIAWMCAFALLCLACSGPPPGKTDIVAPTLASFKNVDDALGYSCGTLDCHGQQGRNLKVWSKYGMRIDDNTQPRPGIGKTNQLEIEATYRSVVGLEPEMLSQVFKDGGRNPQRLTLIRKARGTEAHKGHKIMSPAPAGQPAKGRAQLLDLCITRWLAGNLNGGDAGPDQPCTDPGVAPPFP